MDTEYQEAKMLTTPLSDEYLFCLRYIEWFIIGISYQKPIIPSRGSVRLQELHGTQLMTHMNLPDIPISRMIP